jgi:hypothetical protein
VETDTTKAMQEALQAAVSRMNSGSAPEPRQSPMEMLAPLVSMLPSLLQNRESGEDVAEKIEELRKGELAALQEQVRVLRKQCVHMMKAQEQMLARLRDLQRQQAAAGDVVLELAQQLARIRFVGDLAEGEDDDDYEREVPLASESTVWARSRPSGSVRSRNLRESVGRARP